MSISEVLKNDLCLGCGLCESVFDKSRVKIEFNGQGYLRPVQLDTLSAAQVGQFKQFCPGINIKKYTSAGAARHDDPIWGEYNEAMTGYSRDDDARERGSSGGVLTAMASYLIESGEVEAVLHVGQSSEIAILTEYKVTRSKQSAVDNAGSRYAPSATLINLDSVLDRFSRVAVVAKPCEIAALRQYQALFPEKGARLKYLMSFFCAGVPSMKGTEASIRKLGVEPKDVKSLRYRGEGWPGYFKITDQEGKEAKMSYNDSWGNILNRYLQFRCKICPDGIGEQADIVCADAWEEAEGGYPSFEQRPGQSLIMTRTETGSKALKAAVDARYVEINDSNFPIKTLRVIQPYQFLRKANVIPRVLAMKMFLKKAPSYEWGILRRASREVPMLQKVKNFLGTAKRLV